MPIPTSERPFDRLAVELAEHYLAGDPGFASALGLTEYDELLPDMSADAVAARERAVDAWSDRLGSLGDADLRPEERLDRDLALMVLRGRVVLRDWADWRRSADLYASPALSGVFTLLLNRLRPEPEVAQAVAARLRATPELLAAGRTNLDPDLAHPAMLRRGIGMVTAGAAYARSVAGEIDDEAGRAEVAGAGEIASRAFDEFAAHLTGLAEQATGDWAIGEARYDALLRGAEGLGYGARELRERGQAEYDELSVELSRRAHDLRGHDDWRKVLDELNADHPATPDEMLELYREAAAAARAFCVEHQLVSMPEETCLVLPAAPFTRSMIAVAHCIQPPPFARSAANTGYFFVPYPPAGASPREVDERLAGNNRHIAWPVAVHEAYPGHHWHFAWLAANTRGGGARPLRSILASSYFVEGWGLYTEDLLREQGFYRTPEQELAQRQARIFRAARVVVDTSLHLGEMTIDEATEFISGKVGLSPETARAEVLRYCAWPTQASSYLTGALEIARMRQRWLDEARGSLCDFHDRAAGSGQLPISLVERAVFE